MVGVDPWLNVPSPLTAPPSAGSNVSSYELIEKLADTVLGSVIVTVVVEALGSDTPSPAQPAKE